MQPIHNDIDVAVYEFVIGEAPDGIGNYNRKIEEASLVLAPTLLPALQYLRLPPGDKLKAEAGLNALDFLQRIQGDRRSGFPLHKTAIRAWILTLVGKDVERARDVLRFVAAVEPKNAFYQLLNEGATPNVRALLDDYCPVGNDILDSSQTEWLWEQAYSGDWPRPYTKDGAPKQMLWDCIFVANLLPQIPADGSRGTRLRSAMDSVTQILLEGRERQLNTE